MPKSHTLIYMAFWLCIFSLLNVSLWDLFSDGYYFFLWLPIACSGFGAALAEAFVLAAWIAFGPLRIMTRVFVGWGVGLLLFGCIVLGVLNYTFRKYPEQSLSPVQSQLGFLYVHVAIAIAAMSAALILVRRRRELRLAKHYESPTSDSTGRTQWSLLDLMTVTLWSSFSFVLYRFIPIQMPTAERSAWLVMLLVGLATTALLTPTVAWAIIGLLVQLQRMIDAATTSRSRLQPFLVCLGLQGLLVLSAMVLAELSYSTILLALLLSLFAIFGAFATTIIAALTFANFAGWRLRGRRENSTILGA